MGFYWGTDLANYLPQPVLGVPLITPTSAPITLDEFSTIIGMIEGEVHAAIAEGGYSFPIPTTASVSFNYVKKVVSDGAQAMTLNSIGGQQARASDLKRAYDEALKAIREGKVTLLGGSEIAEGDGGRALPRGGGIASPVISASWMP